MDCATSNCFALFRPLLANLTDQPAAAISVAHAQQAFLLRLDDCMLLGAQHGLDQGDLQACAYAVCAAKDEFEQREGSPFQDEWGQSSLQLQRFGETTAGEGFFVRMESLATSLQSVDVLAVYASVLALGFRGRHHQPHDAATLVAYRTQVGALLGCHGAMPPLSIRHLRPRQVLSRMRRPYAKWLFAGGCVLALSLVVSLEVHLLRQARDITARIHTSELSP